jgi:hypothetical protein
MVVGNAQQCHILQIRFIQLANKIKRQNYNCRLMTMSSIINNALTTTVSTVSSSKVMETVKDIYPKIQSANRSFTFAEYLIATNIEISSFDKWNREIRQKYPYCLVDMKCIGDSACGDLFITTYMPSPAHDVAVGVFNRLIHDYCRQGVEYKEALSPTFPSTERLQPDAGMGLFLPYTEVAIRTVLIEVDKCHRSLRGLHEHMIDKMSVHGIQFGVGIKINQRRTDESFAVVCLLFHQAANVPVCFRAIDFGTSDVDSTQQNEIANNIGVTLEVLNPRVRVRPTNRFFLDEVANPWINNGTFTIPANAIFGGFTNGQFVNGLAINLPVNPPDLVVDLFEVLENICKQLGRPVNS